MRILSSSLISEGIFVAKQPKYNRVEIAADLGFGERVILFADFSAKGISSGVPRHVKIQGGVPDNPGVETVIDETQRTTTHARGNVVTHWPTSLGRDFRAPWEMNREELKSWSGCVTQKEELNWNEPYKTMLREQLVRPKRQQNSPTTLQQPVTFREGSEESPATHTIVQPSRLSAFMATVPPEVHAWQIIGGWPYVVLTLSNVESPKHETITDAGRDYR